MLERIFGSKAKVKILRALASNPDYDIALEDVARNSGLALGTVHPAIKDLAAARIVLTRRAGRSTLYKINVNHLLYAQIVSLFTRELNAHRELAEEFATRVDKTGIESIILFGSVARGEYAKVGDVDILFVTENGSLPTGTGKLAGEFLDRHDTIISPMPISSRELKNRLAKFDGFALRVAEEGILMYGEAKWLEI
ncbi:MAG: nucleotidyltransferase domain-containing protein [Thermoplasmata archaeon]|nr:nucleotidyltransferase domain-containing protein [Thermoplasmata archaeon]